MVSGEFLNLGTCFEIQLKFSLSQVNVCGECLSLEQMLQCCGKNRIFLCHKRNILFPLFLAAVLKLFKGIGTPTVILPKFT